MLVIDSEKLSQQIHETESDYMEKNKEVLANGQETEGAKYQGKVLNRKKKLYEYSYAAEPPVQFRLSHLSRRSEPL